MIKKARILLIRGGAIGDFILTLPAISELRQRWPDAYIELLGYPRIAEIARLGGLVDRVVSLDKSNMASFFAFRPVFSQEQKDFVTSFDLVVTWLHDPRHTFRDNLRSAGVDWLVEGSPMVTKGCHAIDHLVQPLEQLAIFPVDPYPTINLPDDLLARGREILARLGLNAPVLAIHPGSGSLKKNWPVQRYLDLARTLQRAWPVYFVVGEADEQVIWALGQVDQNVPILRDITLMELAAVLSHGRSFIGNDSGITHLAAAVGLQVLALFGPTDPEQWGPRSPRARTLQAPDGRLENLGVNEVLQAVREMSW